MGPVTLNKKLFFSWERERSFEWCGVQCRRITYYVFDDIQHLECGTLEPCASYEKLKSV